MCQEPYSSLMKMLRLPDLMPPQARRWDGYTNWWHHKVMINGRTERQLIWFHQGGRGIRKGSPDDMSKRLRVFFQVERRRMEVQAEWIYEQRLGNMKMQGRYVERWEAAHSEAPGVCSAMRRRLECGKKAGCNDTAAYRMVETSCLIGLKQGCNMMEFMLKGVTGGHEA